MAPFLSFAELLKHSSGNSQILAAGETFGAVVVLVCTSRVFLFLQGSLELIFRLRARSDFYGALNKDRALITCLSCGSWPSSWSVTSTGCRFGSAILFCSDARAQLPLRLVHRPQNMQNGQKYPIRLGLCPNHIFCSWGPIMLEILQAYTQPTLSHAFRSVYG